MTGEARGGFAHPFYDQLTKLSETHAIALNIALPSAVPCAAVSSLMPI
jgi:hypothetical protein